MVNKEAEFYFIWFYLARRFCSRFICKAEMSKEGEIHWRGRGCGTLLSGVELAHRCRVGLLIGLEQAIHYCRNSG